MSSTIKVDNIQDQDGNNIINENSNTITIGASGDTVTLASGASQTGFGRTGTVNWETTVKTANFTAANGEGYFVNTTSGAITVTLPASPSAGDIVAVADYAGTAATNNITIDRNGSKFEGGTNNGGISTNRQSATFIFTDATQGWIVVNSNDASFILPAFVTATGGTVTTCGNFKIHTFTGPGTFCVSCAGNPIGSETVDYLVVAGGGAGGRGATDSGNGAGGGGAGGYRESSGAASGCYTRSPLGACVSALPVTAQAYPITVGGGGTAAPFPAPANTTSPAANGNGSNSIFSTITSTAGGGGGNRSSATPQGGAPGGSGGGSVSTAAAGSGNTPPVTPAQGRDGATASPGTTNSGTGGGGAIAEGGKNPGSSDFGGNGGNGATSCITGSPVTRAGGGGGGGSINNGNSPGPGAGGSGGSGGGGDGADDDTNNATGGTSNTGGGGGGGSGSDPGSTGQNGGSGIVIIRYKYQ